MFYKKRICSGCRTGKETYKLDRHSDFCPYIACVKKRKCPFYKPLKIKCTDFFKRHISQIYGNFKKKIP